MDTAQKPISLDQALRAQSALRDAAGLAPETFPLSGFVGMISDEIDALRKSGRSDAEIARLIATHSGIEITEAQISENYASPEQRQQGHP